MKKIIPYLLSLLVGSICGYLVFNSNNISLSVLSTTLKAQGFQLGVFNNIDLAKEYVNKYPSSIIIKEDDVYRVYISILTDDKTIAKMSNYLNNNKIAFYLKDILVKDSGLIKALNNYEKTMLEGNDDTFMSINKMIMESYGGGV